MQHGLAQAKARLSELMHLVDAGQEVVIAKHGRSRYRLVAVSAPQTQNAVDFSVEKPTCSLNDLAYVLASFGGNSRAPRQLNFMEQWREGARF